MKKLIITHIFLNLYLLAILQPTLPILEYLVNYNYIVSELCKNRNKPILSCNGKCYLEKQVEQQLNHDRSSKETDMPPKVDFEKLITIKTNKFIYSTLEFNNKLESPNHFNLLKESILINAIFKPPRF